MPKVTIEDISRHTGLSRGTVSRALNNRPDISIRTKERVLEACQKLNYSPSHAARSLATGRNYALSVLVEEFRSDFSAAVLRGIAMQAGASHYATDVIEVGTADVADRVRTIAGERVDALLNLAPLDLAAASALRDIAGGRPIATTTPLNEAPSDLFAPDDVEAGRMAARFVLTSRPGGAGTVLLLRRGGNARAEQFETGFAEIGRGQGFDASANTIVVDSQRSLEDQLGGRAAEAGMIVATDDRLAIAAMLLAERHGRRVGEQVGVVGCGNEPIASQVLDGLTSIDFDAESLGQRMVDTVLQRVATKRMDTPQQTYVAPKLVERGSTRLLS